MHAHSLVSSEEFLCSVTKLKTLSYYVDLRGVLYVLKTPDANDIVLGLNNRVYQPLRKIICEIGLWRSVPNWNLYIFVYLSYIVST